MYGTAGLTGVFLMIILVIMVLFSLSCVRRKGFFEVDMLQATDKKKLIFVVLGVLLDSQSLYSLVHPADSPWHTLLEVVLSSSTGLYH